jgi:hypothetical protein
MAIAPKVCILDEADARALIDGGIAYKCSSRRHHHLSRKQADLMIKTGELLWLGKHKKVATFRDPRRWAVKHTRSRYGVIIASGWQLVRGGA